MAKTLTLRNVPDAVAGALRKRAKRNGRSVQRELLDIVEAAVVDEAAAIEQLAVIRARLSRPLGEDEIRAAIAEGRS